ncbi:MAG: helix-turn-helix domain-containing protein [Clostridia bacterium]|nr:helix-turn-helix domain-containing protein [Clostridia bacterium]
MDWIIKEARAEYGLTQKDLSEITDIPLRTIENWESGKRTPSPWVEKLVYSYLKQYPKNRYGIVTETKGTYEVNQIKDALLPLTIKYDINKIILYGSYAKGEQEPLSDIDLVVYGNIKGIKFFGLLEDVNNAFVKSVDLIHISQIEHNSDIYKNVMKGIILYER